MPLRRAWRRRRPRSRPLGGRLPVRSRGPKLPTMRSPPSRRPCMRSPSRVAFVPPRGSPSRRIRSGSVRGPCERRESNPHALRHWNLNPARLPISPLSRSNCVARPLADCGISLPSQEAAIIDPGNPRRFLRSIKWKKAMDGFFHGQLVCHRPSAATIHAGRGERVGRHRSSCSRSQRSRLPVPDPSREGQAESNVSCRVSGAGNAPSRTARISSAVSWASDA